MIQQSPTQPYKEINTAGYMLKVNDTCENTKWGGGGGSDEDCFWCRLEIIGIDPLVAMLD